MVTKQMVEAALAAKVRDYRAEDKADEQVSVERGMMRYGFHHPFDPTELVTAIIEAAMAVRRHHTAWEWCVFHGEPPAGYQSWEAWLESGHKTNAYLRATRPGDYASVAVETRDQTILRGWLCRSRDGFVTDWASTEEARDRFVAMGRAIEPIYSVAPEMLDLNEVRDCRLVRGDQAVLIGKLTAHQALTAMQKQDAAGAYERLYADDRSFAYTAMDELKKAVAK